MFQEILSIENIRGAYLDLVKKFDETSKSHRYCGVDGLTLNDLNISSKDLLARVQKELIDLSPLDPVLETDIPKKDGTARQIFIYTIKDRIKAQAIYRVVEPFFDKAFSSFLFSYRSSHPYYKAAASVAKRYRKYYGQDTVLISDVSNYFPSMDKIILREKLAELGFKPEVIALMNLFIDNSILRHGKVIYPSIGLISGVPLIVIYANLYLNEIDHYIGKKVALYRRVGDDFVLFDKNAQKIQAMWEYLKLKAGDLKLTIKEEKTRLIKSDEPFKFLGHQFEGGKICLPARSFKRATLRWSHRLKYYPVALEKKLKRLDQLLFRDSEAIHNDFIQLIGIYRQVDDQRQIQELSEEFFRSLTRYFFGDYSPRNRRLTQKLTARFNVPSLHQYYLDFHHGKTSLTGLFISNLNSSLKCINVLTR